LDKAGLDQRFIANLKMHFCQWRNPTNPHNPRK